MSRMFGNGHVRFLRGCGRAIVQSYLTLMQFIHDLEEVMVFLHH
ncbi:hypothetical protein [uncultured Methanobrevibacter sp.]|nr:hypothetical protein [uncultured Methanobrevibacter sp.]